MPQRADAAGPETPVLRDDASAPRDDAPVADDVEGSRARPTTSRPLAAAADPLLASLRAEQEEATRQLAALTRDFDEFVDGAEHVNTDDEHDPEGSTIAFERAMVSALRESAERRLAAARSAEARLRDGSYGVCEGCGAAISPERLEAVPGTVACVTCSATGYRPRRSETA